MIEQSQVTNQSFYIHCCQWFHSYRLYSIVRYHLFYLQLNNRYNVVSTKIKTSLIKYIAREDEQYNTRVM